MLPIKIAGLGWYLPERRVTNAELERRLDLPAAWIERVTGVIERRYASYETSAGMGAAAARMALDDAGMRVDELDAIVGASAGPQQTIPCTAALVQRELGAPEGVTACFDINATCLSFLFALQSVAHLVAAGVYRSALIFSSELGSRSLNPRERESAVLFGDAAAAAIVTRASAGEPCALWRAQFATYSSGADLTRLLGGGTLHHPNDPATTPEMNMFHMRGPAVFKHATRLVGPFLDQFFAALGRERQELDAVVPHQASRHGLDQLTERFGFRAEQIVLNLALRGNCIAASIPLALAEAAHAGRVRRGQQVLLLGTGAGLTIGAVALTY
jgi:3-oxoacyl-[acyl-carrier-protein] synthase III